MKICSRPLTSQMKCLRSYQSGLQGAIQAKSAGDALPSCSGCVLFDPQLNLWLIERSDKTEKRGWEARQRVGVGNGRDEGMKSDRGGFKRAAMLKIKI